MRPVSRTVPPSTGDSAGAPGLFRVDTDTTPCGLEDATPGSRASVRVLVRAGRVGRAGLPGAFWCASPFPLAALSFCCAWPPPGWGCPFLGPLFARPPPLCFFFLRCCFPRDPSVSCFLWFAAPGAVCCLFCWLSVRSRLVCVSCFAVGCSLVVAAPPPPLCVSRFFCSVPWVCFFFLLLLLSAPPLSLAFSGFRPRVPWALALSFVFFFPRLSALRALSPVLCLPLGLWLFPGGCCPPTPSPFVSCSFRRFRLVPCCFFFLLCAPSLSLAFSGFRLRVPGASALCVVCFSGLPLLGSPCALASFVLPAWPLAAPWWLLPNPPPLFASRGFHRCRSVLRSFFLPALCAPVVSGFLWFPAPGALGLGAVPCLLCWPPTSLLSVRSRLFRASRLALGCSLVVAAPPPPLLRLAVFAAAARCYVPCAVLCCVSLGALLRRAAARCAARCCAAVCCVVLMHSFGAAASCAVPSGAARRPRALCFAALCFGVFPRAVCSVLCVFCRGAVVRAVVRRSALCCVCPGVLCCAFPVLSALCGAVLRCAGALALCCLCGACCCWRLVLWCICCVLCCFLWCAVVRCWVWWPMVVCWWRVSVSVSLSGRVVCFPVVGVVCCGALLPCVMFCGAVMSRGAALLCCVVVLRCCWRLLCPPVVCRAVLCCAVGWLCCFLRGGGVCVLWFFFPRAVRTLSSPLCALLCLAVLAVEPCFPMSCAVALCCRVVLWRVMLCCAVLLVGCAVFCPLVASACCGARSLRAGTHKKH